MLPLQYSALFALRQWCMDLMTFQTKNENVGNYISVKLQQNSYITANTRILSLTHFL